MEETPEEIRRQHIAALGADLGPVFNALYNDVIELHLKWLEYRRLFATSQERIELLNQTAPSFFSLLQIVLWDDVLLHITRLTDEQQGKKGEQRLVITRLKGAIKDKVLAAEIRPYLKAIDAGADFAREPRNHRIAHTDLAVALGARTLPRELEHQIDTILVSFRNLLNAIYRHYFRVEVYFQEPNTLGDADSLLGFLKCAVVWEKQRLERHRTGRAIPEDHETYPRI